MFKIEKYLKILLINSNYNIVLMKKSYCELVRGLLAVVRKEMLNK